MCSTYLFRYIAITLGMGTAITFNIFLNGLMDTFGTSYGSTSLITSVQMGILYCISPITSRLVKKFGCRIITIVGSLVAATGLISSGLSQSIGMLYVTAVFTGNLIYVNPRVYTLHMKFFLLATFLFKV